MNMYKFGALCKTKVDISLFFNRETEYKILI